MMKVRYAYYEDGKSIENECDNPGSYMKSVVDVDFADREYTETYREVTTDTGYVLGRARLVKMWGSREVWDIVHVSLSKNLPMTLDKSGPCFDSWEEARGVILAEWDRREREAREAHPSCGDGDAE